MKLKCGDKECWFASTGPDYIESSHGLITDAWDVKSADLNKADL
jgi:hypothetical protein